MIDRSDPLHLLFVALVNPQPPVHVVITAGTWIEYCLHRLLRHNVPHPDLLGRPDSTGIPYASMVRLVAAMGILPLDIREPLLEFGRIRNRFAHDITTVLIDADVAKFVRVLPADISKNLGRRPRSIGHFQWTLLLLCQELHRLLPDPDETEDAQKTYVPEDRNSFLQTFTEMMLDLEDNDAPTPEDNSTARVIPLGRGKRRETRNDG